MKKHVWLYVGFRSSLKTQKKNNFVLYTLGTKYSKILYRVIFLFFYFFDFNEHTNSSLVFHRPGVVFITMKINIIDHK